VNESQCAREWNIIERFFNSWDALRAATMYINESDRLLFLRFARKWKKNRCFSHALRVFARQASNCESAFMCGDKISTSVGPIVVWEK
jgi:hypothetical protein